VQASGGSNRASRQPPRFTAAFFFENVEVDDRATLPVESNRDEAIRFDWAGDPSPGGCYCRPVTAPIANISTYFSYDSYLALSER